MKTILMMSFVILSAFTGALVAQDTTQARHQQAQKVMRQKLVYSQSILEGLTLEKYDLVVTNAALLRAMNLTNSFLTLGNPDYKRAVADFQGLTDHLQKAAENKELWTACELYNRVAQSCVRCHQQFRRDQFNRTGQIRSEK